MISLHLHKRRQNIQMWDGWLCGRTMIYLRGTHAWLYTAVTWCTKSLTITSKELPCRTGAMGKSGKLVLLLLLTPCSTSAYSCKQPCDSITNFPLSLPKLQTCWESPTVRNMVSLNFFPFQLQKGNIFSKLDNLLGSIMPCSRKRLIIHLYSCWGVSVKWGNSL